MIDDHTRALILELRDAARTLNGVVEGLGMSAEHANPGLSSSDLDRLDNGVERMQEAMFSWRARMHPSRRGPDDAPVCLALVTD